MYSRLLLSRNLLSESGVIFISIDENRIWWGKDDSSFPDVKQFLFDVGGRKISSLLVVYEDYGHTDMVKNDLIKLFPDF